MRLALVVLLKTLCIGLAVLGLLASLLAAYIFMLYRRTALGDALIVGVPLLLAYLLYRALRQIQSTGTRATIETILAGLAGGAVLYFAFQLVTRVDV